MTDSPTDAIHTEVAGVFLEELAELLGDLPNETSPQRMAKRIATFQQSCELVGLRFTAELARPVLNALSGAALVDAQIARFIRVYTQDLVQRGEEIGEVAGIPFSAVAVDLPVPRAPRRA